MKIAQSPSNVVTTNSGCLRTRKHNPPTYPARCNQKTPRKNSLNESNISMKKYHHKPTFGVKSGSRRCTPYVDDRNSQDPPVVRYDMYSSTDIPPAKKAECKAANDAALGGETLSVNRRSKQSKINGGRRRTGYSERYEANARASIAFRDLPLTALTTA